ncbi:MAG: hypothetical protein Ct9H300mP16_13550 [Pseudomonadota bacterium]|nr:MAG: hypothetical protein Ct9H300mP16_13550 [Pseudomonadota bacterium]
MAVTTIPQRELPADAGDQRDPSHAIDSLHSVPDNVRERPAPTARGLPLAGRRGSKSRWNVSPFLDFSEGEFSDVFKYGMHIESAFGEGLERPRHPVNQSTQPVPLRGL